MTNYGKKEKRTKKSGKLKKKAGGEIESDVILFLLFQLPCES